MKIRGFIIAVFISFFLINVNAEEVTDINVNNNQKELTNNTLSTLKIQEINGNKYCFDENGVMQKGIIDINGTRYFFGEYSGVLKYGVVTAINGDIY